MASEAPKAPIGKAAAKAPAGAPKADTALNDGATVEAALAAGQPKAAPEEERPLAERLARTMCLAAGRGDPDSYFCGKPLWDMFLEDALVQLAVRAFFRAEDEVTSDGE